VIDINPLGRWLLVNLIIAPFRAPKSAKLYREIWTKEGSPLLLYGIELKRKAQEALGGDYVVELGMRYQSPSIESAFQKLISSGVDRIVVLPLYPQYASSTTRSTITAVHEICDKLKWNKSKLQIIERFHHLEPYKKALVQTAANYDHKDYDHVLFSFHGIPQRHITKTDKQLGSGQCAFGACCETIHEGNKYCYRANCVVTARNLATSLGIPKEKYTISFQSRLGRDPWVQPYSDHAIVDLGKSGKKKLLVFSPAFVADCLETIHEIAVEYDELFHEHGGEKVTLVPSLNAEKYWVDAVVEIVRTAN